MEATSPSSIPSSCTGCSPCGQPSGPTRPTAREPLMLPFLQASAHRPLQQCQPAPRRYPHLPRNLAPHPLSSPLLTQPPLSLSMEAVAVVEWGVGRPAQEGPRLPRSSLTLLPQGPPRNESTHLLPQSLQQHPPVQPPPPSAQPQPQDQPQPWKRPKAGIHGLEGLSLTQPSQWVGWVVVEVPPQGQAGAPLSYKHHLRCVRSLCELERRPSSSAASQKLTCVQGS